MGQMQRPLGSRWTLLSCLPVRDNLIGNARCWVLGVEAVDARGRGSTGFDDGCALLGELPCSCRKDGFLACAIQVVGGPVGVKKQLVSHDGLDTAPLVAACDARGKAHRAWRESLGDWDQCCLRMAALPRTRFLSRTRSVSVSFSVLVTCSITAVLNSSSSHPGGEIKERVTVPGIRDGSLSSERKNLSGRLTVKSRLSRQYSKRIGPRPGCDAADEVVLDGVCHDVVRLFELRICVGQSDNGGLRAVPKALPMAVVGVQAPGEDAVEITQKSWVAAIVVDNDEVVMVAHGAGGHDADVVSIGGPGEDGTRSRCWWWGWA